MPLQATNLPDDRRCNNLIATDQPRPRTCAVCGLGPCWYAMGTRAGEGSPAPVKVQFPHPFTTLDAKGAVSLFTREVIEVLRANAIYWAETKEGGQAALGALNAVERLAGLPETENVR